MTSTAPPPAKSLRNCACGCLVGCLALVMLAGGLLGLGGWWVFTAPQQESACRIAGADSIGVVELRLDLDDPGVQDLLEAALEAGESDGRIDPGALAFGTRLLPRDACLVFEPGAEPRLRAAVNFRAFTRVVEAVLRGRVSSDDEELEAYPYRGTNLLISPSGPDFAFVGGTALLAEGLTELEAAVDRALDGGPPSPVIERLDAFSSGDDDELRLVLADPALVRDLASRIEVGGRRGELLAELAVAVEGVELGIDLVSAERAVLRLELPIQGAGVIVESAAPSVEAPGIIEEAVDRLRELIEIERRRLEPAGVVLEVRSLVATGGRAELELEIVGLRDFLRWLLSEDFGPEEDGPAEALPDASMPAETPV